MAGVLSMDDKRKLLQGGLDALTKPSAAPQAVPSGSGWIIDVWDDKLVYELGNQTFEVTYAIGDNSKVTFGEPVKVVRATIYKKAEESLRRRHANLIQESARHSFDISKAVDLASKALAGNGDAVEALKEVDVTMAKLLESPFIKLEEGVKYPAEAFAYTPDRSNPSGWLLRMREGSAVTKAQLNKAASWLSPGGCAGKHVEIPLAEVAAVKRTIRNEYRRIGVPEDEISKWVKEAEMRDILAEFTPLSEAVAPAAGKARCVVIKAGFNADKGRFYPEETLARDYSVFEGVKMYADHPTDAEDKARPERSIKDWVATLKNVTYDHTTKEVTGEPVVVEPWMQGKLATLRDKKMLNEMGISINAVGQASKQTVQDVKTNYIERLVRARSVDFVTTPGAGGMMQVFESSHENDVDIISIEALRERRPDLVDVITTEVTAKLKTEVKTQMDLKEENDKLKGQVATLTEANTGLQTKIDEAEKAGKKATAQAAIKEAIAASKLPEPAKTRLLEKFADALDSKGLDEAIKAERDYIADITESGKVKGLGPKNNDSKKTHEALVEGFMSTGLTKEEAEIAATGR